MAASTYQGSVVTLAAADVSGEITTFTLTPTTNIPSVMTFGGQVVAQGETTWEGEITCIYDNTSGSAYKLLKAEVDSPTSGGYAVVFEPEGTATGNEQIAVTAVVGDAPIEAAGDGGVQVRAFPFTVNGTPTFSNQA